MMKRNNENACRAPAPALMRGTLASLALVGAAALAHGASAQDSAKVDQELQKTIQHVMSQDLQNQVDDLIESMRSSRHFWWWNVGELAETEIFFEENTTDGDLGIQFFLDGDGWDRVQIFTPRLRRMVDIKVRGNARDVGLTEIFSESAEPSFDDLPRDEFLALFDEGPYLMLAHPIEGGLLVGIAELTKNFPDAVEITAPEEEEEVDPEEPLVVEWELVDDPDAPDSVIVGYVIVIEKDEDDEPNRVLQADMLPTDTSLTVAPGFLEPGKAYKVEIIAIETSNNKTITELEFETEGDDDD